jgi:hypothetical protein
VAHDIGEAGQRGFTPPVFVKNLDVTIHVWLPRRADQLSGALKVH